MRIGAVTASFDPVTESEIRQIRQICRENSLDRVILCAEKEGILPYKVRMALLRKAVRPWRRLCAGEKIKGLPVYTIDTGDEEKVREGHFGLCASGTRRYLLEHGLYFEEIVNARLKPSRSSHSMEVAKLCVRLAQAHGVDTRKAYQAGLMHDVTKNSSFEWNEAVMKRDYPVNLKYHPNVWHSFTAVTWLREELGISDPEILNAVYAHTLGNSNSKLAKILYIADKTEPTRGWNSDKEVALSMKDLTAGRDLVLKEATEAMEKEKNV